MSMDLESQRSSISSYHDEVSKKEAGILTNVEELKDESAAIKTLLDGAAHRTSKKSFLAWAAINTLATIGIVNTPNTHSQTEPS